MKEFKNKIVEIEANLKSFWKKVKKDLKEEYENKLEQIEKELRNVEFYRDNEQFEISKEFFVDLIRNVVCFPLIFDGSYFIVRKGRKIIDDVD